MSPHDWSWCLELARQGVLTRAPPSSSGRHTVSLRPLRQWRPPEGGRYKFKGNGNPTATPVRFDEPEPAATTANSTAGVDEVSFA